MSMPSRRVLANRNAAPSLALPALTQEGVTPKGSAVTRAHVYSTMMMRRSWLF